MTIFAYKRSVRLAAFKSLTVRGAVFVLLAGLMWSGKVPISHAQEKQGTGFPMTQLQIGMYLIKTEVAANQNDRSRGLMGRKQMGDDQGMAFVFQDAQQYCMWMRNTLIPLSVAFVDAQGKIINIANMEPQTDTNHCANKPALFALEMNKGWFAKRGFGAGTEIQGLKALASMAQ